MSDDPEKVIDIKTRKKITHLTTESDVKTSQFLTTWKKFCKDTRVESIMIVTIDENNFVTWGFMSDNDYHMALAALTLEDLREEIREELFGDDLDEDEE